jgi:hypothetical protein
VAEQGQVGTFSPQEPSGGRRSWATHRWHRDGANIYPTAHEYYDDLPALFERFILPGHLPPVPMLSREDSVVTLGSCFAQELRNVLDDAKFSAGSFWIPSGLNNTFAIVDFVTWSVTGDVTARGYRYDRDESGDIVEWMPVEERDQYRSRLAEAGAFVFTFGLAEVWEDRETGAVFWRGVPEEIFDADRHVFRLSTVEENEDNILRTIDVIRSVNSDAPIVLTLSPVPLQATFRPISCMTADCVSKSILRVALDRVMTTAPTNVYYWPSFELVKWAGSALDWRAYGLDARHVEPYMVRCIVDAFARSFYGPSAAAELRAALPAAHPPHRLRTTARRASRMPGKAMGRIRRAPARLRREVVARTSKHLESGKNLR